MMKRFANLLAVFILSVNCISAQNLQLVKLIRLLEPVLFNPVFSGNNYPGATVPCGMVQLSPDTRVKCLIGQWGL